MPKNLLRKTILILTLTSFFFLNTSERIYSQQKLTLQQAIQIGLQNNLQIKQAKINEDGSTLDVYKSKTSLLPNLNLTSSGNVDFGRSLDPTSNTYISQNAISSTGNLSSNFTIFQGHQKINQIQQNKYLLDANKSKTQKVRNDIIIQIITSYLAILNYRDQLIAANQQYDLAKTQLDLEFMRFQVGKKTLSDLSKSKYELSKTQTNITNIQNSLDEAALELKQNMNVKADLDITLSQPTDTEFIASRYKSPAKLFAVAINKFPEIKSAEFTHLSALKGVQIAKGAYYPVLGLSAVLASSYLYEFHYTPSIFSFNTKQTTYLHQIRNNAYEYIGLNLSVPLFNGFNTKISIKKARLEAENTAVEEDIVKDGVYKIISQAISDYNAAEKNYFSAQQSFEFAKQTFDVIQKRYNSGSSNSFDFNQSQNDMNQAQLTLINDKYTLIYKAKILDFYSGSAALY